MRSTSILLIAVLLIGMSMAAGVPSPKLLSPFQPTCNWSCNAGQINTCCMHLGFRSVVTEFDYIGNGETAEYAYYMKNASLILEEIITKRKYDKSLAPLFEPMTDNFIESKTRRLDITFGLNFVKLFNMDAEKQILEARLELAMDWRDARLVWDKRKFGNVSSIVTTTESIWIPDTCITNTKKLEVVTGQAPQNVRIFSNGSIHMVTAYFTETACSIDANIFPFDKQNCSIPVLSLTYLAKWISLHYRVNTVSSTLVGNGEWLVLNALPIAAKISENLEIGSFLLMIKRVPNFYVYVIALPCFILTSLSIIGMFWSPNHKKEQLAKLSIGLTSLVSLTVLMEMLADAIPKTQAFPLLGIYVVACLGVISMRCDIDFMSIIL
ncbi:unnamed protein product, partial [Mesorhabditis belari]|uniref:Neurotransmitter-gated ion-channel ligand-binding domain-containing protein n=1 Tax=Mesorhabditis belari TaxID=2138241 RepID=A0AAF3EH84_9BILA